MRIALEWNATALIAPVNCPKCISRHISPWSSVLARIANLKYAKIWYCIDTHHKDRI